ncbi:sensor histidine kinase [Novosphingobium arvoryzae]|uniref:sensor histidine kinase n=1 Tax=Novosphingobium arvoryzae TaxID=1256514 RepID=UPI0035B37A8F
MIDMDPAIPSAPAAAPAQPPRVPARIVLASIAALWVTYFALATLRGWLVGLELHDALLWRRMLVILASMVVTVGLWPLLRLLDPRTVWIKIVAVLLMALPASLLLASINQWVFAAIEDEVVAKIGEREGLRVRSDEAGNLLVDPLERHDPVDAGALPTDVVPDDAAAAMSADQAAITIAAQTREDNRWRQLTDVALGRYFLLLAWAALYFALVNAEQARAAERREGAYRRAAKAAELRSLRYQVNPHFLFNTLNSLSALVMTGKTDAAEEMIQTLSTFYRRSLAGDPTADVALEQEIALQRLYLEIEGVRFPERLKARIDIPDDLLDARVPGMILQPLVENSVKYGVAPTNRAVHVCISARSEGDQLVITVGDDGPGAPGGPKSGFGIGLANVEDRLAARYGNAARLSAGPVAAGGWRTVIRLPLEAHAG